MTGIIENKYTIHKTKVEVLQVESDYLECNYIVSRSEYEGGKVHLKVFDPRNLKQLSDSRPLHRDNISRVMSEGEKSKYPDVVDYTLAGLKQRHVSLVTLEIADALGLNKSAA